jgi:hypothetical protein
MLSSPPPAGYGLPAESTQSNQLLVPSGRKQWGGGNPGSGVPGLSNDPLSGQSNKLTMMIQALMGQGGNNVSL